LADDKPELLKIAGSSTKWETKTIEERIEKIVDLVNRRIRWDVIRSYAKLGELRNCEICGEKESGGFWCKPCTHKTWCCICCILLGIPNYSTGVFVIGAGRS